MIMCLFPVFGWYLSYTGKELQGKLSQHPAVAAPESLRLIIFTSYCRAYISTSSRTLLRVLTAPGDSALDVHDTQRESRKPKDVHPKLVINVIRTP